MRKSLSVALLALLVGQPVAAEELCEGGPREQWLSTEAIEKIILDMGYSTEGYMLAIEDGCLEAKLIHDGERVEVYFEPVTGEVVKLKQE